MEGSNHIMVFTQLGTKKPVEVRAKCTLVPLTVKADKNEKTYILNAARKTSGFYRNWSSKATVPSMCSSCRLGSRS